METTRGTTSHKMRLLQVTVDGNDMQIGREASLRLVNAADSYSVEIYIDGSLKV